MIAAVSNVAVIIPVVVAVIAPIIALLISRWDKAPEVRATSAGQLWEEGRAFREALTGRVRELEQDNDRLQEDKEALLTELATLRNDLSEARAALIAARGTSAG